MHLWPSAVLIHHPQILPFLNIYIFFFKVWENEALSFMPVVTQEVCDRDEVLQDMALDGPELFLWGVPISLLWGFCVRMQNASSPSLLPATWPGSCCWHKGKEKGKWGGKDGDFSSLNKTNLLCKRCFCHKQWYRNCRFPSQKSSSLHRSTFHQLSVHNLPFFKTAVGKTHFLP